MTTSTAHDLTAPDTLVVPEPAEPARRRLRVGRAAGLAVFVALLACLVLIRPVALGGSFSCVIVAGESMLPTLSNGDVVITKRQDSYRRGDIVAYRIPAGDVGAGRLVIHRVTGGNAAAGYLLKGDNRRRPDVWRPRPADIQGKQRLHVPGTGQLLVRVRSPLGIAVACALLAFLVIAYPTRPSQETGSESGGSAGA